MVIKKKTIATVKKQELAQTTAPVQLSPIEMIQQLKSAGLEVADMKEMLALQKEYEENEAKKAFNLALAEFKSEDIFIEKDKNVSYTTDKGTTAYNHATLGNIVAIAVPFLSNHGFSHRWDMKQTEGGVIRVEFILTHKLGHSEGTGLQAGLDQSGGKNNIQALASTVTYLERYTFLAGTGLAAADQDDDGQAAGSEPVLLINDKQIADLSALIDEVGITEEEFLKVAKHESLSQIPADRFSAAVNMLERRRDAVK